MTFVDGAVVLLEGPAAFTLNTTGAGKLERGKLSAVVSPQAVGFVVETPILRIVDLSTEFGVESIARETTTCEVHVFQGSVELQVVGEQGPVGARRVLRQVQGVTVDGVIVDGMHAADVVIVESEN